MRDSFMRSTRRRLLVLAQVTALTASIGLARHTVYGQPRDQVRLPGVEVKELQQIADSSDSLRRNRGRLDLGSR